jgi:hypothetical protein
MALKNSLMIFKIPAILAGILFSYAIFEENNGFEKLSYDF